MSMIDRRKINPARRHKIRAKRDTLGGIVVAGDGKHRDVPLRECAEKTVEKLDRLGARHGAVVYIARDHNGVGMLLLRQAEDFLENEFLVVDQGKLIYTSSEMQVGQMKEFQVLPPTVFSDFILPPLPSHFNLFPGFRHRCGKRWKDAGLCDIL